MVDSGLIQALQAIAKNLNNPSVAVTRGTSYLWANGILIQWGSGTILGIAGGAGITTGFPIVFDSAPTILLQTGDTNAWSNSVVTKGVSGFVAKTGYTGSNLAGSWFAVGVKASRP